MAFLLVGEEKFPIDLWKPQVDTPSMKGPSEKTKKTNPPKKKWFLKSNMFQIHMS